MKHSPSAPRLPDVSRRRFFFFLVAVGIGGLALALGYWIWHRGSGPGGTRRSPDRWNVVLVTIDTLRADYVGAYGAGRARTPAIDALAGEGVRFDHCIAQAPLTLPSHTSLLSATQPLFHRVRDNGAFRAPQELELLSEVLRGRGFATAAFIGGYVLHGKWGLNQGFDAYEDRFDPGRAGDLTMQTSKSAGTVLAEARAWLEQHGERRFFTWIHLYDPHFPYEPPAPFDRQCAGDPYRGEVEYTDAELGRFFAYLKGKGWYDRTLVVVTSDHGEGLNEHGEQKHGYFLYQTTIHVPLIVRAPRPLAARSVRQTVQLIDVAPTVLDLLRISAPARWQGKSMGRLLAGKEDARFGTAYSETWYPRLHYGWANLRTFISDRTKYIYAPRDELYDLARDAGENTNLALEKPRLRGDLRGRGLAFMQKMERGALAPENVTAMSVEDRRRLAALGYLSGTVTMAEDSGPLADPKDKLGDYVAFGKAVAQLESGRWQESLALAQGIVARNPEFADAVNLLGKNLLRGGRYDDARQAFTRALALKPEDVNFRLDLIKTWEAQGQLDEAASTAQRFLRDAPMDTSLMAALGQIRLAQHRDGEGLSLLERALKADPGIYPQLTRAAESLLARGQEATAVALLRAVQRESPGATGVHYLLAQIAEGHGRVGEATDEYRRELSIDATGFTSAVNLANLLKQRGDWNEAARYYRMAIATNAALKMPRFHLAEIVLRQGGDLGEAIALCQQGIELPPRDRETLFGYFVLTNVYAAQGNDERRDFYTRQGERLIADLEKR